MLIKRIDPLRELSLIEAFLKNAGSALFSFRYFDKRPLATVQNHLVTLVGQQNDTIISYGHLDTEEETTWLGIAVAESAQGKGHGKRMLQALIAEAKTNNIKKIKLSVDKVNVPAIHLYEQYGFVLAAEEETYYLYNLVLH